MSFFILIGGGGDTTVISTGIQVSLASNAQAAQVASNAVGVTLPSGIAVSVAPQAAGVTVSGNINVEVD